MRKPHLKSLLLGWMLACATPLSFAQSGKSVSDYGTCLIKAGQNVASCMQTRGQSAWKSCQTDYAAAREQCRQLSAGSDNRYSERQLASAGQPSPTVSSESPALFGRWLAQQMRFFFGGMLKSWLVLAGLVAVLGMVFYFARRKSPAAVKAEPAPLPDDYPAPRIFQIPPFPPARRSAIALGDRWAVALGANYIAHNAGADISKSILPADSVFARLQINPAPGVAVRVKMLERDWSIRDRQSALTCIRTLLLEGQRGVFVSLVGFLNRHGLMQATDAELAQAANDVVAANPQSSLLPKDLCAVRDHWWRLGQGGTLAWDTARLVYLVQNALVCGYLKNEEGWTVIHWAAELARDAYSSWEQYAYGYLTGYRIWSDQPDPDREALLKLLLKDKHSPWVRLPWDAYPQTALAPGPNPALEAEAAKARLQALAAKAQADAEAELRQTR